MATAAQITTGIKRIVGAASYGSWTIGITNDPTRCKREYGNPTAWMQWQVESAAVARGVETYFRVIKGMTGTANGDTNPTFVYIF